MPEAKNQTSGNENDLWTFGQLVAVILLASPVLSMVWKFVECAADPEATAYHSRALSQHYNAGSTQGVGDAGQDRENILTDFQLSPETNSRDTQTNTEHTSNQDNSIIGLLDRNYYATASWIWPGIASAYLAILTLILFIFLFTNLSFFNGEPLTMTEFWITIYGMSTYPLIGFPSACTATFVLGMHLDGWFQRPSGWKWSLLFLFGCFMHSLYMLMTRELNPFRFVFWPNVPFGDPFETWHGIRFLEEALATSCLLYFLYVFGCGVVLFVLWLRSRSSAGGASIARAST